MNKEGQPYRLEPVSKLTPGEAVGLPLLSDDEYAALKSDTEENGVVVPISIDEDNALIDGHHRLRACTELGIETVPTRLHSQLDPAEKRDRALALNLNRRNLSREQKRDVIAAVLRQHPEYSDRHLGALVGADGKTVKSVRDDPRAEIPHVEKRTDRKGRKQPASKPKATSRRRLASDNPAAKPGRARTRAERQAKILENGGLPFLGDDADLRKRVHRIADEEGISMNEWIARVVRAAVEDAESKQLKKVA